MSSAARLASEVWGDRGVPYGDPNHLRKSSGTNACSGRSYWPRLRYTFRLCCEAIVGTVCVYGTHNFRSDYLERMLSLGWIDYKLLACHQSPSLSRHNSVAVIFLLRVSPNLRKCNILLMTFQSSGSLSQYLGSTKVTCKTPNLPSSNLSGCLASALMNENTKARTL